MPGFELFGDEERKEVNDVLETGVLFRYGFDAARKGHWKAKSLEAELVGRLDVAYAHLCSSGTAALITAMAACGVGADDEVIVPPFTFVATFEAVLGLGAVPVFAEVDETLCLDPKSVEAAITRRTKAVMPVHMCGSMARIDAIQAVCERRSLILLEDACQSIGGTFQGKALGTFGRMGCYSFDPVKTITCGEGGAVVTDDPELYARADAYTDHGHDHVGNDRGAEDHILIGTNFRISELNAAVGLAQIRKLDQILATQRKHKAALKSAISGISGVSFREIPDPDGDSATFLTFFMPDADAARETVQRLGEAGVDGCFYWFDNNWHYIRRWDHLKKMTCRGQPPFHLLENRPDYDRLDLPASDAVMSRAISLQIKLSWTEEDVVRRADALGRILRG